MSGLKSDKDDRISVSAPRVLDSQVYKDNVILSTGGLSTTNPVSLRIKWPLGKSAFGFLLPRPRWRGGKAIPFVRQVEPESLWTRRRLLAVYVFGATLIALVMVSGVVLSVFGRDYFADRRCLDPVSIWNQTEAECGHLWRVIGRKTRSDAHVCRVVPALARCVVVSLRTKEQSCSVQGVARAVESSVVTTDVGRRQVPCGVPHEALVVGSNADAADSDKSDWLYRLARTTCSRMINAIEGSSGSHQGFCQKLQGLWNCLSTVLGDSIITTEDVAKLFPSEMVTAATRGLKQKCQLVVTDASTAPSPEPVAPCLGILTATETEAFVNCSSYLSLHTASNSSDFHCRLHGYMVWCIRQRLEKIGSACPLSNIVRRLATDLSRADNDKLRHIHICKEFIHESVQVPLCQDSNMLTSITLHACAQSDSQPFQLTRPGPAMSDQFSKCSRFSALVTCLSEFLTSTDVSCNPNDLENNLANNENISLLMGKQFSFSECQGPGPERICHDGRTVLQIAGDTCNIALDFVRGEVKLNYKCSYFRQFVTCAQTLLQSRGYECLFDDLLLALKRERSISRRSGLDPSLC